MRLILSYLRPHRRRLAVELMIKFMGTIMDLLLPLLLSVILNDIVPTKEMGRVVLWGGLMALCALLCWLCNVTANKMSTAVSRDVTQALRGDLFQKTLSLSCAQADSFTVSSLVSRMTSDTYNIHQFVDRMQRIGVRAPIMLIGGVFATLTLDPALTLVLALTLPLLAFVVTLVSRKSIPLYTGVQEKVDALVRKVQENMAGVRVIKALSRSDYEIDRFDEVNRGLTERDRRAGLVTAISSPVINLILNAGLTLIIVVGAYRVNLGLTKPGTIIAFLNYFIIILNAVLAVTRIFILYSKGAASAQRVCEVMQAPAEPKLLAVQGQPAEPLSAVKMDRVSFSYNKRRPNLRDVSFALAPGQTLGVIGATGSGKTTLLALLLRLYDADEGVVSIFGRDIRAIPLDELYPRFGVVFQNDFLFAGSLRENIRFGRELDDQAILSAAAVAQADFIREAGALDRQADIRGGSLSGGQRQRVLISRAVAARPDILLLDDCSSALDYQTDAALRHALKTALPDTTKVIVSQRASAIRDADLILVLDGGEVIGQGTHAQLLTACPAYAEICRIQMGEEGIG